MRYLLIFLAALSIVGCKHPPVESNKESNSWESLTIISENHQVININNIDDTSMVKSYDNGSIFAGFHKAKVDSLKTYFTMAEKDTLFKLSKEIIANPVTNTHVCTDFVGDLKLTINYNKSLQQSISYSGICKWDSLSPQTIHLHHILKRRIGWWKK